MTTQPDKNDHATPKLEGSTHGFEHPDDLADALERAFDYRGDVTIETDDGRKLEGYIYDRRRDIDTPYLRLMPSDGSPRMKIEYASITRLGFTGRDTAAGKSWETWVRKYVEKKMRGEKANIESDPLEEEGEK